MATRPWLFSLWCIVDAHSAHGLRDGLGSAGIGGRRGGRRYLRWRGRLEEAILSSLHLAQGFLRQLFLLLLTHLVV
jgi:hypothetical protein